MISIMNKILRTFLYLSLILFWANPVEAQSVKWISLSKAQDLAESNDKKIMLFTEAEWCGYCTKMHEQVFTKSSVQDSLAKYFYPVRIDIESNKEVTFKGKVFTERILSRKFRVTSTPTVIFLTSKGNIIGTQPGFLPAEIFDKLLAFVGNGLSEKKSFKEYLHKHGVNLGQ